MYYFLVGYIITPVIEYIVLNCRSQAASKPLQQRNEKPHLKLLVLLPFLLPACQVDSLASILKNFSKAAKYHYG